MQRSFEFYEGLPARPRRPERLFFGLLPDPETVVRATELRATVGRRHRLAGTPIVGERLHLSLQHVGDYTRLRTRFVHAARQAAEAVSTRRFEMRFRAVGSFDGPSPADDRRSGRPLVLLAEGEALWALHAALGAGMEANGLRAAAGFTPHMTLSYGTRPVPLQAIEPIRVAVDAFVLIHSELGLTRYNLIDRWPLQG